MDEQVELNITKISQETSVDQSEDYPTTHGNQGNRVFCGNTTVLTKT